jgi:hypothetical protein
MIRRYPTAGVVNAHIDQDAPATPGTRVAGTRKGDAAHRAEVEERNQLMEALLRRTAHFRVGRKRTREEMSER